MIIGVDGFLGNAIYNALSLNSDVYGCDINHKYKDNYFCVKKTYPGFSEIFTHNQFDLCINCSGSASVHDSISDPFNDFNANLSNVGLLLESILKFNNECKLLNISSAAVYGNPISLPIKVEDQVAPLSPYGVHKYLSERLMSDYSRIFGLQTCSVRVFSVYGNGQKKLFLWDCFNKLNKVNQSSLISFFGTGNESRDYIHISDIVKQIELVINNAQFHGEVYNMANGEEVFIKDLVSSMKIALHSNAEIHFTGESRIGDPLNWKADIAQMLEWGYIQSVSISEGINQYVKWAKENA